MERYKPTLKALWNVAVAVVISIPTVFDDWAITGVEEWCLVAAAVANALLVWLVPNMKSGIAKHAKGIVAIVVAVTAVVPVLAIDGWDGADSWEVAALVLGALVTPLVPNPGYVYARKIGGAHADPVTG